MTGEEVIHGAGRPPTTAAHDHAGHDRPAPAPPSPRDRPTESAPPAAVPVADPADRSRIVTLRIPARFASVRLARLVASGLAAEHGLDVVAIENLRLVVDEACAMLLECSVIPFGADGGVREAADVLDVEFTWDDRCIVVRAARRGGITSDIPSEVSTAVLDAVAASWRLDRPDARVVVTMRIGDPT